MPPNMGMAQKTGMDMNINIILFRYKYKYRNKYIAYYGTVKVLTHCHETQQEGSQIFSRGHRRCVFSSRQVISQHSGYPLVN